MPSFKGSTRFCVVIVRYFLSDHYHGAKPMMRSSSPLCGAGCEIAILSRYSRRPVGEEVIGRDRVAPRAFTPRTHDLTGMVGRSPRTDRPRAMPETVGARSHGGSHSMASESAARII